MPPTVLEYNNDKIREDWEIFMQTEIKKLGEVLQQHKCQPLCHKYGNKNECHFQLPHELVPFSYLILNLIPLC